MTWKKQDLFSWGMASRSSSPSTKTGSTERKYSWPKNGFITLKKSILKWPKNVFITSNNLFWNDLKMFTSNNLFWNDLKMFLFPKN